MWLGHYAEALDANIQGVALDDAYLVETGAPESEFYKFYRLHNMHFAVWAAMFDCQMGTALKYARKVQGCAS